MDGRPFMCCLAKQPPSFQHIPAFEGESTPPAFSAEVLATEEAGQCQGRSRPAKLHREKHCNQALMHVRQSGFQENHRKPES